MLHRSKYNFNNCPSSHQLFDPIAPAPFQEKYPLTLLQERTAEASRKVRGANNITCVIPIEGPLDVPALQDSLNEVCTRHFSLHSRIFLFGDVWAQEKNSKFKLNFVVEKSSAFDPLSISKVAMGENLQNFNLEDGPGHAYRLVLASKDSALLFLTWHHAIMDRSSEAIFLHELMDLYCSRMLRRPSLLTKPEVQITDVAVTEKAAIKEIRPEQISSLKSLYDKVPDYRPLHREVMEPVDQVYNSYQAEVDAPLWRQIKTKCRENKISVFALMLAAFSRHWAQATKQEEFIISLPSQGRWAPNTKNTVGCLFQSSPLIVQPEKNLKDHAKIIGHDYKLIRESLIPTLIGSHLPTKVKSIFNFRAIPNKTTVKLPGSDTVISMRDILTTPTFIKELGLFFNRSVYIDPSPLRIGGNLEVNFIHYEILGKLVLTAWYRRSFVFRSPSIPEFVQNYFQTLAE